MFRVWCLGVLLLLGSAVLAQNEAWKTLPEKYVDVTVSSREGVRGLGETFIIDKVTYDSVAQHYNVRLWLPSSQFDQFLAAGIPYTEESATKGFSDVAMAWSYEEMADWNRYPTYETYLAMMDTFAHRYPNLCTIDTLLAETPDRHIIMAAHITLADTSKVSKPSFFYSSTIHGDEPSGFVMMLHLIDYILTHYPTDDMVKQIVENVNLWICPLENPDGTYHYSNDTLGPSPISTRANFTGRDLNRIYPWIGQENVTLPPEAAAMVRFFEQHQPTMSAVMHGGAEVFNYPWDSWTTWQHSHADAAWWEYVGHRFADTCQHYNSSYMNEEDDGVTPGGDWYVIEGSMQDYHNWYLGTRHVTIEVSDDKVLSTNYLPSYWGYIRSSLLNFIDDSRHGIHGTVTDSITGEPLEALVYIANHDLDHSYVESVLPHGDYHRPIKAGQYSVTYSADGYLPKTIVTQVADGQTVLQNVQLTKTVGIEDYESCIAVYPNPAKDFVTVEISGDLEIANIALYDVNGRMVRTNPYSPLQSGSVKLDVHDLYSGTYILHLKTADGREIIRKIAKQ